MSEKNRTLDNSGEPLETVLSLARKDSGTQWYLTFDHLTLSKYWPLQNEPTILIVQYGTLQLERRAIAKAIMLWKLKLNIRADEHYHNWELQSLGPSYITDVFWPVSVSVTLQIEIGKPYFFPQPWWDSFKRDIFVIFFCYWYSRHIKRIIFLS